VSAALYGTADFLGGLSAARWNAIRATAVSQLAGVPVVVVGLLVVDAPSVHASDLWWGLAAGVAGIVGIACYYHALSVGPMSVAAPVAAVVSAVIPLASGIAGGERPSALAVLGVAIGVTAVVLLSASSRREPTPDVRRALLFAVLGGAGFGGFYALLGQASASSGLWPLVPERVLAAVVVVPVAILVRPSASSAGRLMLGVAAGLADMAANVLFLLATHRELLSLVGVIVAMYPASTVLLARWVLGERLRRSQLAGILLAGAALALIAAG
jgi:drug/metabolite transporter (DMT)-like permease